MQPGRNTTARRGLDEWSRLPVLSYQVPDSCIQLQCPLVAGQQLFYVRVNCVVHQTCREFAFGNTRLRAKSLGDPVVQEDCDIA